MNKNFIYKNIACGFDIAEYSRLSHFWVSLLAFLLVIFIKQYEYAEMILLITTIGITAIGEFSIKNLEPEYKVSDKVVINDMIGTFFALYFFSESLLLNIYAFLTYQLIDFIKRIIQKKDNRLIAKSIIIGSTTNIVVYITLIISYQL